MISRRPPSCAAAAWKVRRATDCGGSWEESPPTLIDIAVRDRRWAQGNLQHMKIIGSAGLRFISRMHLGVGIMSYLSSPMWLVMIGIGFALAIQSRLIRPEYFSHDFQLFPTWPRFDVALMMALFWFSMVVLLIPKMLGLIRALLSRRIRHAAAGGVIGTNGKFLARGHPLCAVRADFDGRAMPACIRSVHGTRFGLETSAPRRRPHEGWGDAWRFHRRHMLLSCVTAVIGSTSSRRPC